MLGWVRFVAKELDSCWIRSVNDQDETVVRFDPSNLSLAMKVIYRGMPKEQRANNYATVLDGAPPIAYPWDFVEKHRNIKRDLFIENIYRLVEILVWLIEL